MKTKKIKCPWLIPGDKLYEDYHDNEWGRPVHNDKMHFELLCLEGAQAGLSWITVLKKRAAYRLAFDNFDPEVVSLYTEKKVDEMMNNTNLIRHKKKLNSCISNAKAFIKIQKEFGSFDTYVWQFVGNRPIIGKWQSMHDLPTQTEISIALSKDLRKKGFLFVGPKIIYSYMQAAGLVIDHTVDCFLYSPNK
ncbi:MAG: DNA-3-methyladenine glycosylase I [Chlamydiae bacterium]|nr:DNA-3-methyladenine glycosylase I [Chlamydiota bacterium]